MSISVATPAPTTEEPVRAPYTSVAALGLLLAAAAPAVMLIAAVVAGQPIGEDGIFFGLTMAVPLVAAGLVWRFGRWAKVVGIVAGVLAAFALFWTVFGLSYPGSFADFVPGILLPLGAVLAVGGGVAAIVAGRRGRGSPRSVATERRIVLGALAVVAVAAVVSAVTMTLSRSAVDADAAVEVELADFAFDQESYTITAEETTTVRIHNSDAFAHTFTVPDLGIDETVLPGSDALVEIEADAGEYTIYCAPHSDMSEQDPAQAGMAARLIVS